MVEQHECMWCGRVGTEWVSWAGPIELDELMGTIIVDITATPTREFIEWECGGCYRVCQRIEDRYERKYGDIPIHKLNARMWEYCAINGLWT